MITNFSKYNLLTESKNYFDKYDSILIALRNKDDIIEACNYINDEIGNTLDNPISRDFVSGVKDYLSSGETPYIRYNRDSNKFSYGTLEYLHGELVGASEYNIEKEFEYSDLKYLVDIIKNNGRIRPKYEPKKFIYESKKYFKKYKSIPIKLNSLEEIEKAYSYIVNNIDKYTNNNIKDTIKQGAIEYLESNRPPCFLYNKREDRWLYGTSDRLDKDFWEYEKFYTVNELDKVKELIKYKDMNQPKYNPRKFIYESNNTDLILEKSSLTKLGVPREVMQPIQRDLALSPDAEWEKMEHKKDVVDYLRKGDKNLFIQIGVDDIKVIGSYPSIRGVDYFIDNYIYRDTEWAGEYEKSKRHFDTLTQTLINIDPRKNIYRLKGDFSINKQPKRKMIKKEKSFMEFSDKFKTDFLKQFDKILKRITGTHFKKAKDKITDKAKRIAMENDLLIKGIDNPLSGPNGLSILDEFLFQFEEEYSKFFEERIDIQELSKYFTYDKVMTMFMYYIYTGKILAN